MLVDSARKYSFSWSIRETIALCEAKRRAISCVKAVRAVSEKDCWVVKLSGFGEEQFARSCSRLAESLGPSAKFLGW